MHTFIEEKVATYNAYIPINDINFYDLFDDKLAFIKLNIRNFSDYAGVEYNATDKHIIIKNYAIGGMRCMVRLFNHFFKDSNLKMKEKKYYTLHVQQISSREFKILEVPSNNIDKTSIESSIRRLLHASDFDERKKHKGEFIGFGKEHTVAKALEITAPFNPKSAFKQSLDKIIVEFQNEADLFNACDKNYHFSDFNIKGYPLDYNWPQRDCVISKLKKLQFDKSNHTPDKSTQPQLVGSHEIAGNYDDDSKEKVNNKLHIQGQHITLGVKSHCSMNNNKDNIIISNNTSFDTSSTHSNTPNNQNRQGDWDEYKRIPTAYNKNDTPDQQHLQDIDDQVMQDINDLLIME
ncbi:unnamed protein product [Rhizophagus irregularis]|nr:unnamed protein product [Rhizophagus irregularis]